jgi:hypothetical protein
MSRFKPQQRHLTIRGRLLHFVSYEGSPGNPRRAQLPYPAMWYLMVEGRRCPVVPCDPNHSLPQLDAALCAWAEDNALGPIEKSHIGAVPLGRVRNRDNENWWGPN